MQIFFYQGDIYKTMKAGAYADLNEFMKNDKNFKRKDYVEPALKAGQLDGKQYLMPLEISTPAYITTKRTLEETKLDFSKYKTTMILQKYF